MGEALGRQDEQLKPQCPMCGETRASGECEPCELFLCHYCARWVSWADGATPLDDKPENKIEEELCTECIVRRHPEEFGAPKGTLEHYGYDEAPRGREPVDAQSDQGSTGTGIRCSTS